jgi:ribosomal protein S18 acetylase RimI-like enzyme
VAANAGLVRDGDDHTCHELSAFQKKAGVKQMGGSKDNTKDILKRMVHVRAYNDADRLAVRRIALETAFYGEPWERFIDDGELLADIRTLYYTDYGPEGCFVAEAEGVTAGYVIGSKDVLKMNMVLRRRVIPRIALTCLKKAVFFRKTSFRLLINSFIGLIKGEFLVPDVSAEYPANLHINVGNGFRGAGIGSGLISRYEMYLKEKGVKGVHLTTMSDTAKHFFEEHGFKVLFLKRRSFLKYYFKREFQFYVMGKKL